MKKLSTRTRVVTAAAGLAIVGAGTVGALTANASTTPAGDAAAVAPAAAKIDNGSGKGTFSSTHVTIDTAIKAAQASLDAAEKAGQRVTVAVVDRNGNTIVTLRGDGAGPQSYTSAVEKAYTAVSWNAPTSTLATRLAQTPELKDIPGTLFLAGGAPIAVDNTPIAAIGVAGAPSGAQDESFAQAGIAAITTK